MRLDETLTRATLGIVRSQLDEFLARQARLDAERDGRGAAAFSETPAQPRRRPVRRPCDCEREAASGIAAAGARRATRAAARTHRTDQGRGVRHLRAAEREGQRASVGRRGTRRSRAAVQQEPDRHPARDAVAPRQDAARGRAQFAQLPTWRAPREKSARSSCRSCSSIRISAPRCSRSCGKCRERSPN